jgi:uncharacterized protein (DUF952 family)
MAESPMTKTTSVILPADPAAAIYKIAGRDAWATAEARGVYTGSPDDARDGFIHFSTAAQVAGTARKFFSRQSDLLIISTDARALGADLKWEPSRDQLLFPHLYAPLPLSAVLWVKPLPLGPDGVHQIPAEVI